jgi:hypothetical protein
MGNITSICFTFKRHFVDTCVNRIESFSEGWCVCCDNQNTSSSR